MAPEPARQAALCLDSLVVLENEGLLWFIMSQWEAGCRKGNLQFVQEVVQVWDAILQVFAHRVSATTWLGHKCCGRGLQAGSASGQTAPREGLAAHCGPQLSSEAKELPNGQICLYHKPGYPPPGTRQGHGPAFCSGHHRYPQPLALQKVDGLHELIYIF